MVRSIISLNEAMHLPPAKLRHSGVHLLLPRAPGGTAASSSQWLFNLSKSLLHLLPQQAFSSSQGLQDQERNDHDEPQRPRIRHVFGDK
jgi:hypothetical protein